MPRFFWTQQSAQAQAIIAGTISPRRLQAGTELRAGSWDADGSILYLGDAFGDNAKVHEYSASGTRTRVARVRAEYPNQLDYSGVGCGGNLRCV